MNQMLHTAFTLHFGCSQCCEVFHPLPHYMQLQRRRVCSLEFFPVAVLEVRSPASLFVWYITSPAAIIGYLKVNQLKGCHTQTPRIAIRLLRITLKPFAVDDDSRYSSSKASDASGLSVVTFSTVSSCVETLFFFLYYSWQILT